VSKTILYIVTENPQVKHVSSNVEQTGVHEHGSEQRRKISSWVGKEAAGNERPLHYESITAAELYKKKDYVQRD